MRETILREGPTLRRRILLALVIAVPILFLRNVADPINVPKLWLLMTGVAVVAAIRGIEILQGAETQSLKRMVVPGAAVLAPLLVALAFCSYRGWALFGWYPRFTGFIPYLIVVLSGVLIADAFAGRTRQLAWGLLVAGGVSGAYALIQFVGLDPYSWTVKGAEADVVASTLGNPNFAGAFFGMVLPVGAAFCLSERDRNLIAYVLLGLVAIGWVVARSEAGWAAGLGGLVLVAAAWWPRVRGGFAKAAVLVPALMVVGAVVMVGLAMSSPGSDRLPDTVERRAEWWKAAISMGADSPVVGHGPGSFAVEHARYRTSEDAFQVNSDITDDPHSVFLAFFAGAGILGLLGIVIAVGWFVRRGLQGAFDDVLATGFFATVCAYVVQATVSIDTVALRFTLWTAAAGLVATLDRAETRPSPAKSRRSKKNRPEPVRNLAGVVIVSLVALLAVGWSFRILAADKNVRDGLEATARGDATTAMAEFDAAIDLRNEYAYRRTYGTEFGRLATALAASGEGRAALALFEPAEDAFSYLPEFPHAASIADFARILSSLEEVRPGSQEEALSLFVIAQKIDRFNPQLAAETTDLALELEKDDLVVEVLEDFPRVERFSELLGNLALAQARLGNEQEAREAATAALAIDPSQADARLARDLLAKRRGLQ